MKFKDVEIGDTFFEGSVGEYMVKDSETVSIVVAYGSGERYPELKFEFPMNHEVELASIDQIRE
jgi:hypothetical protein